MPEKEDKNKFYFFKIDRDKIKLQLKNISSKFIKPKRNKKMIGIFITFFLLVGVVTALYINDDFQIASELFSGERSGYEEIEQESSMIEEREKNRDTINIHTETLTLSDQNKKQKIPDPEVEGVVTEPVTNIAEIKENAEQRSNLLRPVAGEVINEPGWYYHPVFADWRYQNGIKMEGNPGDIVMAAESGEVAAVYEDEYQGIIVEIKHSDSRKTLYGNLGKTLLQEGEIVGKGQEVGRIGTTAITGKPYLYFELQDNGEIVNPVDIIDQN